MKKFIVLTAVLALFTSCEKEEPNYQELIIGQWNRTFRIDEETIIDINTNTVVYSSAYTTYTDGMLDLWILTFHNNSISTLEIPRVNKRYESFYILKSSKLFIYSLQC
jgi:hypothetical protein